jgi:hypothetical protein
MNMLHRGSIIGLLISVSFITALYSQNDSMSRKSNLLVGASFWGGLNQSKSESHEQATFHFECDLKIGYFLSESNLLNFKLETYIDTERAISYSYGEKILNTIITVNYRRYLDRSIFIGAFLGTDLTYFNYSAYSVNIDWDKAINAGLEMGYTHFITTNVGVDFAGFYALNRISYERDGVENYNYSRFGIRMGIVFLFNRKK